ncbi:restriction system-associated AAA family ATPase [Hydrogenophaga pseudoflava]|uniref:restriction system-associated AAA family ATPase n=1 Tax=Hydrogenophaga pseudoflava TaxID=47421 RepID=UPI0027E43B35|nr:restriction system-associated AAA family ATPase [Hydrogenophaga pseudoflava]MDQ7746332.1 restriction system-associated AAA family ATPase [Hydrogenophaga pseudoflava]
MKLLRLKITDPDGFRSLPTGFEHCFRTEITLGDEGDEFAPFVCAGRNGSGKSNLLEALAAIFYQLELLRVRRSFLPEVFQYDPVDNPQGIKEGAGFPNAFELEYQIYPSTFSLAALGRLATVRVVKLKDESPRMYWTNAQEFIHLADGLGEGGLCGEQHRDFLLPDFVVGYSSGENEILSLPFFKMRFIQFDEYWTSLREGLPYPGRPETRLTYLDSSFSQAILLCNLLFAGDGREELFTRDIGIEALKEFRIVLKRYVLLNEAQARPFIRPIERSTASSDEAFWMGRSAVSIDHKTGLYQLDVLRLLEEQNPKERRMSQYPLDALRRCATLEFYDEATDTLILDYWVNPATQQAFRESFSDARTLFQAFQVLLTLNLYTVSDQLKSDLYRSDSQYVSETVPKLASDERVMRFKFVRFAKKGVKEALMLKSLSDGEHQLLHSLGLCLLFRDTNSLFLLDEPETHFNPDWRASFISRLRQGLRGREGASQEMLITTHSPFLISDSKPEKVLVFEKDRISGNVTIKHPEFNTLGASINKITMNTFGKRETVGGIAEALLDGFKARFDAGQEDLSALVDEIEAELGDSVEKILLIKAIQDKLEEKQKGA